MYTTLAVAMLLSQGEVPVVANHQRDPTLVPIYRHIRVRNDLDAKAGSLALNLISTNSQIVLPVLKGNLLVFDANDYATTPEDLKRFLRTWEELQYDPAFNKLTIVEGKVLRETLHPQELVAQLGTEAPVVDIDYFLVRALSTIKDQGGNATIFGGLYYEFAGIPGTENALIKTTGIDPGDDLIKYFEKLPSQRRAAMEKSGVSGKSRRIDLLATAARFAAWYMATRDVADGQQGDAFDPFISIVKMIVIASEVIYVRYNGLHGFALFNGQGERADVGPHDVVVSDMYRDVDQKRNPHSTRLQMPYCLDCHWKGTNRGIIPFTNDILLQARAGIKLSDPKLKELYQADPVTEGAEVQTVIARGRTDLVKAVLRTSAIGAAPGWPQGKGDQLDGPALASSYIIKKFRQYLYEPIDARIALQELNVPDVPAQLGDAALMFNKIVPVTQAEPLTIARLRKGFKVNRFRWSLVRAGAYQIRRLPPPNKKE